MAEDSKEGPNKIYKDIFLCISQKIKRKRERQMKAHRKREKKMKDEEGTKEWWWKFSENKFKENEKWSHSWHQPGFVWC